MFQRFGELPELLLKHSDGNFFLQSSPTMVMYIKTENNVTVLTMTYSASTDTGARIGNADVKNVSSCRI